MNKTTVIAVRKKGKAVVAIEHTLASGATITPMKLELPDMGKARMVAEDLLDSLRYAVQLHAGNQDDVQMEVENG